MNIFQIEIDLTNYCNFSCIYCGTSKLYNKEEKRNIQIDEIQKIVKLINTYLYEFDLDICIKDGEPLLNENIVDILNELQKIKSSLDIRLFTNGSILLNKFNIAHFLFTKFYISLHTDILSKNYLLKTITINNIRFLLEKYKENKINNRLKIYIMKSKNTSINQIDLLRLEILTLYKKYNINKDYIEIIEAVPNHIYINNNYVFDKQCDMYKRGVVYYRKSIKIKSNMTVKYKCPLVTNQLKEKNIYSVSLWKELRDNAKNIGICTYKDICPIFCYKIS